MLVKCHVNVILMLNSCSTTGSLPPLNTILNTIRITMKHHEIPMKSLFNPTKPPRITIQIWFAIGYMMLHRVLIDFSPSTTG